MLISYYNIIVNYYTQIHIKSIVINTIVNFYIRTQIQIHSYINTDIN